MQATELAIELYIEFEAGVWLLGKVMRTRSKMPSLYKKKDTTRAVRCEVHLDIPLLNLPSAADEVFYLDPIVFA